MSCRTVLFKKLRPTAYAPTKARHELVDDHPDAGWDLYADEDVTLPPGGVRLVPTGIAIELPTTGVQDDHFYEAQVRPRSGMRLKGVVVTLGTIDAGYRGDIGCIIINHGNQPYSITRGDRIAQLVVMQLPKIQMREASELTATTREANGFGSSGR